MPWLAIYEGGEKTPQQVPIQTDAECPSCGRTLRVKRRGKDGTSRHFFHKGKIGKHGEGGNGGSHDCETVAETDEHKVWKSWAVDALLHAFGDESQIVAFDQEQKRDLFEERRLIAPSSEKEWRVGDVVFEFDEHDEQLGRGIVVEVQHKNESKDTDLTTTDYVEQGFSVVWMYEEDFGDGRCLLNEVDIRKRAFDAAWPDSIPESGSWGSEEWVTDEYPEDEWDDRLRPDIPHAYDSANLIPKKATDLPLSTLSDDEYIETLKEVWGDSAKSKPAVPATIPEEWFDDKCMEIWRGKDWDELFSPPDDYTDIWCYSKVPATFLRHWHANLPKTVEEYWHATEWDERFPGGEQYLDDIQQTGWSIETDLPFARWVSEDGRESVYWTTLHAAHNVGLAERNEGYPTECPHCHHREVLNSIPTGMVRWVRSCRDCGESYIVYDRADNSPSSA